MAKNPGQKAFTNQPIYLHEQVCKRPPRAVSVGWSFAKGLVQIISCICPSSPFAGIARARGEGVLSSVVCGQIVHVVLVIFRSGVAFGRRDASDISFGSRKSQPASVRTRQFQSFGVADIALAHMGMLRKALGSLTLQQNVFVCRFAWVGTRGCLLLFNLWGVFVGPRHLENVGRVCRPVSVS